MHKLASVLKLLPSYFKDVLFKEITRVNSDEADIYVSIKNKVFLGDAGRYLYLLLRLLSLANKKVVFLNNSNFVYYKRMGKYGRQIYDLEDLLFMRRPPHNVQNKILICDRANSKLDRKPWGKKICLDFDISQPLAVQSKKSQNPNFWMMPFPMHPNTYTKNLQQCLPRLRATPRQVKALFAGNLNPDLYSDSNQFAVLNRFHILKRGPIIKAVLSRLPESSMLIENREQKDTALSGEFVNQCLLFNSKSYRIPQAHWLQTIAQSDFFICAPGAHIPLCHNAVEAMAVGTIPLINYPSWFCPSLQHLHNCVEFKSEDDLIEKVKLILAMEPDQISELRKNVISYYETHLCPKRFIKNLLGSDEEQTTLYLNTGSLEIWRKITPASVLLRAEANQPQHFKSSVIQPV